MSNLIIALCFKKFFIIIIFIFSASSGSSFGIYVIASDGSGTPVQLTSDNVLNLSPSWSSSGTSIVYSSNASGNYDIVSIKYDGTDSVNLTNTSSSDEIAPAWALNGEIIAYVKDNNIFTVNADGSASGTLLLSDAVDPSW